MKETECVYCEDIVPFHETEKASKHLPDMKGRICQKCIDELEVTKK